MKVSELIKELLTLLKENGDCDVWVNNVGCCGDIEAPDPYYYGGEYNPGIQL